MEHIEDAYTRISSILSIYQAYAHVPKEKLIKAQEVGTEIHDAIERYFKDAFTPIAARKYGYFESFLKWTQNCSVEPLIVERRFFDNILMITGKVDLVCMLNGIRTLVDFKTGAWAHPEIWRLQGTFYRYLLQMNGEEPPDKMLFIQLLKTGDAPILYEFFFQKEDLDACLHSLAMYHWFEREKKGFPCT